MDYSHVGGGDQFSWPVVILMMFAVFGRIFMELFIGLLIVCPVLAAVWLIRTFVRGWRGEA